MTTGYTITDDGFYAVECYVRLGDDSFTRWHTLRKFKYQGDAILFNEYCNLHTIDPIPFCKTFRSNVVCSHFQMSNGKPKLTMEHI